MGLICETTTYAPGYEPAAGDPQGYFIGVNKKGERRAYDFGAIERTLAAKNDPAQLGRHISGQLDSLGLYDEMLRGDTPCMFPFTFWPLTERRSNSGT